MRSMQPPSTFSFAAALAVGLWAGQPPVLAQAGADESNAAQPGQAETVVVRARRTLDDRFSSTASTVTVNRQDIEAMGANTIADILRQLPGVQITSNGNGGLEIRMRGMGAEGTRILVDGAAVSSSRQNVQLPLDELPADMIERIEVVRAPTAEFEGAAGGTINVVMRGARAKRETYLWLTDQRVWGRDAVVGFFSQTGPLGAVAAAPSAEHKSTDGSAQTPAPPQWSYLVSLTGGPRNLGNNVLRETSVESANPQSQHLTEWSRTRFNSWTLTPRLTGRLSASNQVIIRSMFSGFDQTGFINSSGAGLSGADPTTSSTSAPQRYDRSAAQVAVDWTHRFKGLKLDTTVSYERSASNYRFDRDSTSTVALQTSPRSTSFHDDRRENVAQLNTKLMGSAGASIWTLGGELHQHRFSVASTSLADGVNNELGLQASIRRAALWLQNEFPVAAIQSTFNVGMRAQAYVIETDAASALPVNRQFYWQPSLNARTKISDNTQLRWNLARITRTPKVWELLTRSVPSAAANSANSPDYVGNASLRPESTLSLDLGIDQRFAGSAQAGINLFVRQQSEVIARRLFTQDGRWLQQPDNVGDALVWGVESDLRGDLQWAGFAPQWTVSANASLLQSRMRSGDTVGARIPGQARYLANLTIANPLRVSGGWYGGGTLALVGPSELTQSSVPGVSISGGERAHAQLDLYVGSVDPQWGFWRLNFYNITDFNKNTSRVIVDSNGLVYRDQSQRRLTPRIFLTVGSRF
jgi:outer membrane receptor for ferrienterochelin and colicins